MVSERVGLVPEVEARTMFLDCFITARAAGIPAGTLF
jgi:hypothetical protein